MRHDLKALGCASLFLALAGCFPEVTFSTTGMTGSTGTGSGGKGSSTHGSSGTMASSTTGSMTTSTVSSGSASATTGTAGYCRDTCMSGHDCLQKCTTTDDCDCDQDGQKHASCSTGGSSDCYDCNINAKHGQMAYFDHDRGDGSYDYDCSGGDDKEYDDKGLCGPSSNGQCGQWKVFLSTVNCGDQGDLLTCKCDGSLLCGGCTPDATNHTTAFQKCH
jgi:hypothetical protein